MLQSGGPLGQPHVCGQSSVSSLRGNFLIGIETSDVSFQSAAAILSAAIWISKSFLVGPFSGVNAGAFSLIFSPSLMKCTGRIYRSGRLAVKDFAYASR